MKVYRGSRYTRGCTVTVQEGSDAATVRPLPLRLDLWNHSPNGFQWGYGGSGPAQLALAILADCLGDDVEAVELHQNFKWLRVATIATDHFVLTEGEVQQCVEAIKARKGAEERPDGSAVP